MSAQKNQRGDNVSIHDNNKKLTLTSTSQWSSLDHQVQNRLLRMQKDFQQIPKKVISSVREKEVPLHQKRTADLMNELKKLKSNRTFLENEIPFVINTVRAQKTPGDALTRCWDPATGVKMKVKDIENALMALEEKIRAVKVPEDKEIRMKLIYSNMKSRYVTETSSLAAKVKDLRHEMKLIQTKRRMKVTILRDTRDDTAMIGEEIKREDERKEMNRMHFKRQLIALTTKQEEEKNMLKVDLFGRKRREEAKTEQTEEEQNAVQNKLDVRNVETLTARGAKGWLQESAKRAIPMQRALKRLEDADMMRDPMELADYYGGLKMRSKEINDTKTELETVSVLVLVFVFALVFVFDFVFVLNRCCSIIIF